MLQEQQSLKRLVGQAALQYVIPGSVLGVGTGSTVDAFIDALAEIKDLIPGAVATSRRTVQRLEALGIAVLDLNKVLHIPVYIDGADEIDSALCMIKGGGGALTQEKIVAAVAEKFICIADQTKQVQCLGSFALPIEVIPMACAHVVRQLASLGGRAVLREGFITDNGHWILDVHGLTIADPVALESKLDHIAGIVSNGLFARRPANILLVATSDGIHTHSTKVNHD